MNKAFQLMLTDRIDKAQHAGECHVAYMATARPARNTLAYHEPHIHTSLIH